MAKGIEVRHSRACRSRDGGRCDCEPSYRAEVRDPATGKRHRKTFSDEAEARSWFRDAAVAVRRGRKVRTRSATLAESADRWLDGMRRGTIRNRSGEEYKASAVRSYERNLRLRVLDELGSEPIEDIRRADLQALISEWIDAGLAEATIESTIIPLQALFKHEVSSDRLKTNPTAGLSLPRNRSRRERIASPDEATRLLAALPDGDRAIWATAMYAGLRRGELMALRVNRIDLDAGLIHVVAGWDEVEGEIEPKGHGKRRVPIATVLREHLAAHLLRTGRRGEELIFGRDASTPFESHRLSDRADAAWKGANAKTIEAAGERGVEPDALLQRITLHECRHTFASLMIAAGCNAKALSTYMGHANIAITFDRYGHLMPGNEAEAADLLDAYLNRRASAS